MDDDRGLEDQDFVQTHDVNGIATAPEQVSFPEPFLSIDETPMNVPVLPTPSDPDEA